MHFIIKDLSWQFFCASYFYKVETFRELIGSSTSSQHSSCFLEKLPSHWTKGQIQRTVQNHSSRLDPRIDSVSCAMDMCTAVSNSEAKRQAQIKMPSLGSEIWGRHHPKPSSSWSLTAPLRFFLLLNSCLARSMHLEHAGAPAARYACPWRPRLYLATTLIYFDRMLSLLLCNTRLSRKHDRQQRCQAEREGLDEQHHAKLMSEKDQAGVRW